MYLTCTVLYTFGSLHTPSVPVLVFATRYPGTSVKDGTKYFWVPSRKFQPVTSPERPPSVLTDSPRSRVIGGFKRTSKVGVVKVRPEFSTTTRKEITNRIWKERSRFVPIF